MNSRFLIPVLCVGAVAFACGPRPHNEASVSASSASVVAAQSGSVQLQGSASGNRKASRAKGSVTADPYVRATPEMVRLAFHVVNNTGKRLELTFPSGQTYDFVIVDSLDREVWRWARGRMFTQALRNTLLSSGETLDMDEQWMAPGLAPGRYTARAVLTSTNHPIVRETPFTVAGTTIASR